MQFFHTWKKVVGKITMVKFTILYHKNAYKSSKYSNFYDVVNFKM